MVTVKKTAQSSRPFHSIRKKLAEAYLAVRVIPLDFHTPSIIEKLNASAFRTVAPYYLFNTIPAVILDILQYGHPALREKCSPIVHINSDILNFLKDMQETLAQAGIGLAAPQVGRPIQMVTINIPLTDTSTTWLEVDGSPATLAQLMPLNFINPVLHLFGKKVPYREGCLSISKVYADVMRRSCVKATLTLMNGKTVAIKCNGLLARCLQHEVDHLHGSLFTDIVSPQDHEKVIRRLRLTHPDAFEEDDDSYARRMKEERRKLAQAAQTPDASRKTA